MGDPFKSLEEITPMLSRLVERRNGGLIEYKITEGTTLGFNLYNSPSVAVQRCFLSKDTVFPLHTHDETEVLIIYKGKVEFSDHEGIRILNEADVVIIQPNVEHRATAIVDSWLIAVTVPASGGYPGV